MRILAAAFTLALLAACSEPGGAPDTSQAPRSGGQLSPSKVIAKGTAYREADYRIPGKVVLLDFYADW